VRPCLHGGRSLGRRRRGRRWRRGGRLRVLEGRVARLHKAEKRACGVRALQATPGKAGRPRRVGGPASHAAAVAPLASGAAGTSAHRPQRRSPPRCSSAPQAAHAAAHAPQPARFVMRCPGACLLRLAVAGEQRAQPRRRRSSVVRRRSARRQEGVAICHAVHCSRREVSRRRRAETAPEASGASVVVLSSDVTAGAARANRADGVYARARARRPRLARMETRSVVTWQQRGVLVVASQSARRRALHRRAAPQRMRCACVGRPAASVASS
jgi:hypothetical protein